MRNLTGSAQNTFDFEYVENDDQAYAEYSSRFDAYNRAGSGSEFLTFSVVLRNGAMISAGVRGHVYLGALEIRGLWVDADQRGKGIGSALMMRVEQEARGKGASKAMLYTYSWQAEGFYTALGYREYARFDFPKGHYRVDMQKTLQAQDRPM